MYVPESFRVSDQAKIEAFVERYDFAALVSTSDGGIVASHLPVLLERTPAGPVLHGHLARSNSHWELMNGVDESLAIFQGPHGYVSPTWYASAQDHAGTIAGLKRESTSEAAALAAFMQAHLERE